MRLIRVRLKLVFPGLPRFYSDGLIEMIVDALEALQRIENG